MCHCKVVNDRAITAAVEAGATTLAALCQTTGAGQNCGACVWSMSNHRNLWMGLGAVT